MNVAVITLTMQSINETPTQHRYITIAGKLSGDEWRRNVDSVNASVTQKLAEAANGNYRWMQSAITTPLSESQIPLYIYACYADIPENYTWDTMFSFDDLTKVVSTTAVSCFGVYFRKALAKQLDHGHQADVVVDFRDGLPTLLDLLPILTDRKSEHRATLGLCRSEDWAAIQDQLIA